MSDDRRYKVRFDGQPLEGYGPYESEGALVEGLREIRRSSSIGHGRGVVHVYEDADTPLGVGRTYVGWIDAESVLMTGEVADERLRD